MHSTHLGQSLAVGVVLSLMLLIVGVAGLGVGLRHGDVMPPDLNIALSGLHIVAITTYPIACRPYLPCQDSFRDYYVVWVFRQTVPKTVPENGFRILTMPLQNRFGF